MTSVIEKTFVTACMSEASVTIFDYPFDDWGRKGHAFQIDFINDGDYDFFFYNAETKTWFRVEDDNGPTQRHEMDWYDINRRIEECFQMHGLLLTMDIENHIRDLYNKIVEMYKD
jgi:hypothetical protein